jgi:phenylpyruvate tautomerase PptA (4-oxalocrotonate tautomerase family)
MPLVRISLRQGKPAETRFAIGAAIHQAMIEVFAVPPLDCFLIITEHPAGGLVHDPATLGTDRTDDLVLVQITLAAGRSIAQKHTFYAHAAALLGEDPGLHPRDVLINLVEVPPENWSLAKEDAAGAAP